MARCGCSSECACVITDGDCTTIAGNGNPGAPYRVNLEIDPSLNNQAVCGEDGLLVEPPQAGDCIEVDDSVVPAIISVEVDPDPDNQLVCNPAGLFVNPAITVADTDCIDLEGDGTPADPLTASPIISPDVANLLECVAAPDPNQGLRARLFSGGSGCIDISGDGTAGDPLLVGLEVSPDVGNTLQCRPNGAFVPAVTQAPIEYRATLLHNGVCGTILPPAAVGATSSAFIDYDYTEEAVGLIPYLCGLGPAYANTYIEVPIGGAGIYLIQATHPAWSILPASAGDMILRLRLWRGDTTGRLSDGIGQSAQTRYSTVVSAFNTPYLHISRTIYLNDGDCVAVDFAAEDYNGAFAGTTLDTGPIYGAGAVGPIVLETAGLPFFQMTRLGLA